MPTVAPPVRTVRPVGVPKPGRSLSVVCESHTPDGLDILGVVIKENRKLDGYHVRAEHDDMSVVVVWEHERDPARRYTATLSHDGRPLWCSCPSRARCKHLDASAALVRAGKIRTDESA